MGVDGAVSGAGVAADRGAGCAVAGAAGAAFWAHADRTKGLAIISAAPRTANATVRRRNRFARRLFCISNSSVPRRPVCAPSDSMKTCQGVARMSRYNVTFAKADAIGKRCRRAHVVYFG